MCVGHVHTLRSLIVQVAWLILTLKRLKRLLKVLEGSSNLFLILINPRVTIVLQNAVQKFLQLILLTRYPPTTPSEVREYISGLKKNKFTGEDRISTIMLIYLSPNFILYFVILINGMMNVNIFPDCWKGLSSFPFLKAELKITMPLPAFDQYLYYPAFLKSMSMSSSTV